MADIFNYPVIDIELKSSSYIGYDIECHQLEDIILNFIVRNQGSLVDLSNYTVELRVKKPLVDGYDTDYIQGKTGITKGTNGTLKIECKNKLTELSGFAKGELRIVDKANKQASTRLLAINILPSTIEVNRSIASSTITVMEELDNVLNNAYDVQEDFENKIADANKAKSDLETVTNTANTTKTNLDKSNTNATNTKNALDTLNNDALTTKTSLDTLNTTATNTKSDLTTINNTANDTKLVLDASNTTAQATKTNLDTLNTTATNTKSELDTLNTNALVTKTDLTIMNSTATTTKNDLNTLNVNAQATKTALDLSKINADNSKTNLDNANTLAEANIEELNKLGDVTDLAIQVQTNTNNIGDLEADKTDILTTIGTENMGTTATTLKGAIAEHENQINNNTTQLNDKANVVNTTSMYLGTFFESNDNIGNNLFITGDGKSLLKINNNNVFKGRDVSILCKGGTFYFFHTAIGGTDNITVKISKDLVNFETKNIKVSDDNSTLWAPDVFVDGEKIYLVYAKSVGNELGANGQTYNDMRPYIVEIINLETMDIGVPRELILQGNSKVSDNRIDGHIIKKDSTYYLFIKFNGMNGVDANGAIEIWTSSDLNAWTIINSGINSWSGIEAPFVTEFDGTYYLYVDDFTPLNYASGDFYKNNGGVTMYTTSTDLINWSTELKVLNSEKSLRHGFICKIEDEDCKRILTNRSVSLINLALKNIKDDYNEKINKVNDSIQSLEDATNVKGYYNNIFVNLSSISSYGMYRGFIPLKNATNYNITLTKMSYMNNVETIEITDTASIGDIYMNGFCVRNTNSVVAGASCLVWFRVEDK